MTQNVLGEPNNKCPEVLSPIQTTRQRRKSTMVDRSTGVGPVVGDAFARTVTPFVAKLRLSETLDMELLLEPEACGALARVLEDMAAKADIATALFKELKEGDLA
jgi:hypothetical protein